MELKEYIAKKLQLSTIPDAAVAELAAGLFADPGPIIQRGHVTMDDLTAWGNFRYAVVDVETTGGRAATHAMTEIGIVIARGDEIEQRYGTLIGPPRPIPPMIQQLTGITPLMLENAPEWSEIAPDVSEMLLGLPIFAHNAPFDRGFVRFQLLEEGLRAPEHWFCTVKGARRAVPGLKSYKLDRLVEHFGIDRERAHRALDDAAATQELIVHLVNAAHADDKTVENVFQGLKKTLVEIEARHV